MLLWGGWQVLELFGADRCMFASNFPVDRAICSGGPCLPGLFRDLLALTSDYLTADQQAALLHGTATRVYRLQA